MEKEKTTIHVENEIERDCMKTVLSAFMKKNNYPIIDRKSACVTEKEDGTRWLCRTDGSCLSLCEVDKSVSVGMYDITGTKARPILVQKDGDVQDYPNVFAVIPADLMDKPITGFAYHSVIDMDVHAMANLACNGIWVNNKYLKHCVAGDEIYITKNGVNDSGKYADVVCVKHQSGAITLLMPLNL